MATKRSLALATQGYDLMDRKRNILVREMMQLIDRAAGIQDRISAAYAEAYEALKNHLLPWPRCHSRTSFPHPADRPRLQEGFRLLVTPI